MSCVKKVRYIQRFQNTQLMYKIYSFLFMTLGLLACQAQESYEDIGKKIDAGIPQSIYQNRDRFLKTGEELSDFLPPQHSKKGDVDYTAEIQKGLDRGGVLLLPDYPILINKTGLSLRSNTTLVFRNNSKLIMRPNAETHYTVLDIREVENVDVYFANIEGDRDGHLISKGEWGMGIRILGSEKINIYAPTITDCWGDGIYIGPIGENQSEQIAINHFKIYKARRNGISVISANNLLIDKGVISNTHGTAPQSAIDIEPNRPSNILQGILMRDVITHESKGDGIMISLSNLTLDDRKIAKRGKIDITIENHTDIYSLFAVRINGRLGGEAGKKYNHLVKLDGDIIFKNSQWIRGNNVSPVRYSPKKERILEYGFNPKVRFEGINILDAKRKQQKSQDQLIRNILKESKKL